MKLTLLSFLLKACAAAIRKHPTFNSSLSADKENLVIKHYLNLGVAVDTPMVWLCLLSEMLNRKDCLT
ncbi:MAG: hypothetical protein CM1200mP28_13890 [Deltaproteobacteria bacterium]|nr:MAG: hypothetical protein CM1200mP28_13890 [Deltaproteobacteria bacterium]